MGAAEVGQPQELSTRWALGAVPVVVLGLGHSRDGGSSSLTQSSPRMLLPAGAREGLDVFGAIVAAVTICV